jgi:ubiquinol-cytochrome c reductase iron-sulfur subunit
VLALVYVAVRYLSPAVPFVERNSASLIDVSKIIPGEARLVSSERGAPVWVFRRTSKQIADLVSLDRYLRDPASSEVEDPPFARNPYRSRTVEILVVEGHFHRSACLAEPRSEAQNPGINAVWLGGFVEACRGAFFDPAGRVYNYSHPAARNLRVPNYEYVDSNILKIDMP